MYRSGEAKICMIASYIVNFDGEMPIDYLSRFYQNMFIKDSRHFEVETRLSGQADSLSIHSVFSPEHDVILALKQSGRLYFTEDEIKNSERVAIVTPDLGQLGDTITVDAIGDLKIIGVLDTIIPRSIYIPCSLFLRKFYSKYYVFCCAKQTEFTGNQIARGFFVCKRKRIHRTGPGANNVSYYQ